MVDEVEGVPLREPVSAVGVTPARLPPQGSSHMADRIPATPAFSRPSPKIGSGTKEQSVSTWVRIEPKTASDAPTGVIDKF